MPHLIANDILIPEIAKLLQEGHEVTFTPGGVSMRPFIEGGKDSVLLVQPTELSVGDVILARVEEERYVLHRLIRIDGDQMTLMGDGNLQGEEHCKRDAVLGKVVRVTSPKGHCKPITKARVWRMLLPMRWLLLKVYRHTPRIL